MFYYNRTIQIFGLLAAALISYPLILGADAKVVGRMKKTGSISNTQRAYTHLYLYSDQGPENRSCVYQKSIQIYRYYTDMKEVYKVINAVSSPRATFTQHCDNIEHVLSEAVKQKQTTRRSYRYIRNNGVEMSRNRTKIIVLDESQYDPLYDVSEDGKHGRMITGNSLCSIDVFNKVGMSYQVTLDSNDKINLLYRDGLYEYSVINLDEMSGRAIKEALFVSDEEKLQICGHEQLRPWR
jgi:hypothetical protein